MLKLSSSKFIIRTDIYLNSYELIDPNAISRWKKADTPAPWNSRIPGIAWNFEEASESHQSSIPLLDYIHPLI